MLGGYRASSDGAGPSTSLQQQTRDRDKTSVYTATLQGCLDRHIQNKVQAGRYTSGSISASSSTAGFLSQSGSAVGALSQAQSRGQDSLASLQSAVDAITQAAKSFSTEPYGNIATPRDRSDPLSSSTNQAASTSTSPSTNANANGTASPGRGYAVPARLLAPLRRHSLNGGSSPQSRAKSLSGNASDATSGNNTNIDPQASGSTPSSFTAPTNSTAPPARASLSGASSGVHGVQGAPSRVSQSGGRISLSGAASPWRETLPTQQALLSRIDARFNPALQSSRTLRSSAPLSAPLDTTQEWPHTPQEGSSPTGMSIPVQGPPSAVPYDDIPRTQSTTSPPLVARPATRERFASVGGSPLSGGIASGGSFTQSSRLSVANGAVTSTSGTALSPAQPTSSGSEVMVPTGVLSSSSRLASTITTSMNAAQPRASLSGVTSVDNGARMGRVSSGGQALINAVMMQGQPGTQSMLSMRQRADPRADPTPQSDANSFTSIAAAPTTASNHQTNPPGFSRLHESNSSNPRLSTTTTATTNALATRLSSQDPTQGRSASPLVTRPSRDPPSQLPVRLADTVVDDSNEPTRVASGPVRIIDNEDTNLQRGRRRLSGPGPTMWTVISDPPVSPGPTSQKNNGLLVDENGKVLAVRSDVTTPSLHEALLEGQKVLRDSYVVAPRYTTASDLSTRLYADPKLGFSPAGGTSSTGTYVYAIRDKAKLTTKLPK